MDFGGGKTEIKEKFENGESRIVFPKPIIIEESIKYNIQLDFSSSNIEIQTSSKLRNKSKMSNGATITFHRDALSDFDNVKKGVIEDLYFNDIKF